MIDHNQIHKYKHQELMSQVQVHCDTHREFLMIILDNTIATKEYSKHNHTH